MIDRSLAAVAGGFATLAGRPGLLFAVCFALNAVFLPYAGLYHDARLYAAQVVQATTGQLAGDLFFKYGSQSQYTILPELLAAPTRWVGVEGTFFVAYLLSNALRLWATQRLAFRLLGPTAAAAAGLVLAAVAPVWWGLTGVFSVNEWFFTARVPAVALSVLAMERALAGRPGVAWGLLLAAGLMHPLMAAPAAAVVGGWMAWNWAQTPGRRLVLGVAGLAAAAAVGAYLAATAGSLDPEWRTLSLAVSPHADPRNWRPTDLIRIGLAAGCAVALGRRGADRAVCRWWVVTVLVAAAGIAAGAATAAGTWALPFQVQPVRAVWPLETLRFPLGLAVIARIWTAAPTGRLTAVVLFLALVPGPDLFQPTAAPLFAAAAAVGLVAARWLGPADDGWLWRGLAGGLIGWAVVWYGGIVPARVADLLASTDLQWLTPGERSEYVLWPFGPLVRLAAGGLAVAVAGRVIRRSPARIASAVGVGLAASVAAFVVSRVGWVVERNDPRFHDARFVADVLPAGPRPTVYWSGAPVEQLWFGLGVNPYFHKAQLSGNVFSRPTAIEGRRRTVVVTPFEIDRLRREFPNYPDLASEKLGNLIDLPPPSAADFRTLVTDPAVDFAVLPYDFGGAVASNGSVWVYDCRALRASHPDRLPLPTGEAQQQQPRAQVQVGEHRPPRAQ